MGKIPWLAVVPPVLFAAIAGLFLGAAAADLPPQEALAEIGVPTLILAWTGDPGHPVETARRLDGLLTDTTLHEASTADQVARLASQAEARRA